MRQNLLDLRTVLDNPGRSIPVSRQFDLSDLELNFQTPAPEPVTLSGEVRNTAGVVELSAELQAVLRLRCDRCVTDFRRSVRLPIEIVLGETRADEENEEIYLIRNESVDLEEIVRDAFVLDMNMVSVCREDCKGLCPQCGQNLNESPCHCAPEPDARLAVLKTLL